ncbi:MAG: DinB family protein [Phycisphaerae bacterium]
MTPEDAIKNTIDTCHEVLTAYVSDMSDADLLIRPVPEAHHIAWQLGHLVMSEHQMVGELGHKMPELPDGFAESYTPEAAKSDDAAKFHGKAEYLELLTRQREATMAALGATREADLDEPTPESMREYAPTVGSLFNLVGIHELMHAGQFVPVRRKLGKPVLI